MGSTIGASHRLPSAAAEPWILDQPAAEPGLQRWRWALPGEESSLRELRRWIAALLPECPSRDDLISVATELASNALMHTASGQGGGYRTEVIWTPTVVRVAIADGGSQAQPRVIEDPDGERGRGLLMVRELSLRTGMTGDEHGRVVWADVAWDYVAPAEDDFPLDRG